MPGRMLHVVAGLVVSTSLVACDKPASTSSSSSSSSAAKSGPNLFVGRTVQDFVADKSLADADVIKAYVLRSPGAPTVFPKGQSDWATVEPLKSGDGYLLWIRRLDPVMIGRTFGGENFDPLQAERDGVKYAAEFCRTTLTDLQSRNLRGIGYTLLGSAKSDPAGEAEYVTMFRVSVTPQDLNKLTKAEGPAAAGSVFDPRTDRVKEIFNVDGNLYPTIQYVKRPK